MAEWSRRARAEDVHELVLRTPHVAVSQGRLGRPIYQVGGRSFVFYRNPRPDAIDSLTGERLQDVIVFWVPSEGAKRALLQDETLPFFTTPHFDGDADTEIARFKQAAGKDILVTTSRLAFYAVSPAPPQWDAMEREAPEGVTVARPLGSCPCSEKPGNSLDRAD